MTEAERRIQLLRFENFEVDLRTGELRKDGVKLKFGGQPVSSSGVSVGAPRRNGDT
jgi:hypothetical protein